MRDELELTLGPVRRTVIARGAAERRVSAAEAANLYDETQESVAERERQAELRRLAGPVDRGGRPTNATAAAWTPARVSDLGWMTPPASGTMWKPLTRARVRRAPV
jgi:hypothetical protein